MPGVAGEGVDAGALGGAWGVPDFDSATASRPRSSGSQADLWELCDAQDDAPDTDGVDPRSDSRGPRDGVSTPATAAAAERGTSILRGRRPNRGGRIPRILRPPREHPRSAAVDVPPPLRALPSGKARRGNVALRTLSLGGWQQQGTTTTKENSSYMRRLILATGLEPPQRPLAFRDLTAKIRGENSTLFSPSTGALPAHSATALLGGPSSGKSSLLKALAGILAKERKMEVTGSVFLSGRPVEELHAGRALAYVAQDDAGAHYPNLTVRETLHFASLCQIPRSSEKAGRLLEAIVALDPQVVDPDLRPFLASVQDTIRSKAKVELIIEALGLTPCADTVIGDGLLRGISGGQRRRVTLAEQLVTRPGRCLLADEITTGLDSASAASVCAWTAQTARTWAGSCLVSLLQPDPAILRSAFNSVIVLAGGRIVFHGPPDLLVRHFEHVTRSVREGDPCEWVLAVVEGSSTDGRSRSSADVSDPAAFFARAYEKSDLHAGQLALVEELSRRTPAMDAGLEEYGLCRTCGTDADRRGSATALTFSQSLWVLAEREALLKRRDLGLVKMQVLRVAIIGLVGGVLFFQLPRDTEGAFNAVGALYFALNFLSFGAMPQMAQVLQWKHIMIRQRNDRWFSGSAYGLVAAAMTVPFTFLEVAIFSPVFYFMAGLSPAGFVPFLVLCFLANMAMGGLFRLLGASCPNLVVASSFGSLVLLLFIVTSGFTIVRSDLPPYLLPVYYLSPFAWGLRAVAINELLEPSWNAEPLPSGDSLGRAVLQALAFGTDSAWIWAGMGYLAGFWVFTTGASMAVLTHFRLPGENRGFPGIFGKCRKEGGSRPDKESHSVTISSATPEESGSHAGPPPKSSRKTPPLLYAFDGISYAVDIMKGAAKKPESLTLLHAVSGFASGGTLTALMGPSGAGKTTLLDVLAGRKTYGHISGEIALNGRTVPRSACAYVEQFDSLWPLATVEESVAFVARLRVESPRVATRRVLDMLELGGISRGLVVSLPMESRKRVSIALELVVDPEVLFLDEPTSSLDSKSAAVVAGAMRLVADAGKAVICTIHQPSTQVFATFDRLLLLQKGGRVAYFGPSAGGRGALASFFEGAGAPALPSDRNPSAWALDALGAAPKGSATWDEAYSKSSLKVENDRILRDLRAKVTPSGEPAGGKGWGGRHGVVSPLRRAWEVSKRGSVAHWRNPQYILTKMASMTLVSLIYGITYVGQGQIPGTGATTANIQNVVGLLYSSSLFTGVLNCNLILPVLMNEREVFYREVKSLYRTLDYGFAALQRELPYLAAQAVVFVTIVYWMTGFAPDSAEKYLLYSLTVFLVMTTFTAFGQLLAVLTPSRPIAQVAFSFVIIFWNAFCGFAIPVTSMSPWVAWIYWICPTTWSLYSLAASQLGDSEVPITLAGGGATVPARVYLEERYGYRYDFRWNAVAALFGFNLLFALLFLLTLRFVNWQTR